MHAYVCFTTFKTRVNISTPLQRRKEVSLLQMGTIKYQRHSRDLGQTAPVTGLAGRTWGLCSWLGVDLCAPAEGLSSAEHGYRLQTEPSSFAGL